MLVVAGKVMVTLMFGLFEQQTVGRGYQFAVKLLAFQSTSCRVVVRTGWSVMAEYFVQCARVVTAGYKDLWLGRR